MKNGKIEEKKNSKGHGSLVINKGVIYQTDENKICPLSFSLWKIYLLWFIKDYNLLSYRHGLNINNLMTFN